MNRRILFLTVGIAFCLCLSTPCLSAQSQVTSQGIFDLTINPAGVEFHLKPDFIQDSIETIERLLEKDKRNLDLLVALAHNYNLIKKHDNALSILERAAAYDNDNPRVLDETARTYEYLRLSQESLEVYEKIVEVDYLNDINHFKLGYAYLSRNRYGEAKEQFKKGLEINPLSAESYYCLGLIALYQEQYEKAYTCFLRSLEYGPGLYQASNNCGVIALLRGNEKKALNYFKHALEIEPDYEIGQFNYGRLLLKNGALRKAKKSLLASLKEAPHREQTHYLLGIIYQELGDSENAIRAFSYLSEHYENNLTYKLILAKLYTHEDEYGRAAELYKGIIDAGQADALMLTAYGRCLEKLQRTDEAVDVYYLTVQRYPHFSKGYMHLSRILLQQGRVRDSFFCFLKSGLFVHSAVMFLVLSVLFVAVVFFAVKIFFTN